LFFLCRVRNFVCIHFLSSYVHCMLVFGQMRPSHSPPVSMTFSVRSTVTAAGARRRHRSCSSRRSYRATRSTFVDVFILYSS
jgi:hypothetical protein